MFSTLGYGLQPSLSRNSSSSGSGRYSDGRVSDLVFADDRNADLFPAVIIRPRQRHGDKRLQCPFSVVQRPSLFPQRSFQYLQTARLSREVGVTPTGVPSRLLQWHVQGVLSDE